MSRREQVKPATASAPESSPSSSDDEVRSLSKAAGDGDLEAARRLVGLLERRQGVQAAHYVPTTDDVENEKRKQDFLRERIATVKLELELEQVEALRKAPRASTSPRAKVRPPRHVQDESRHALDRAMDDFSRHSLKEVDEEEPPF